MSLFSWLRSATVRESTDHALGSSYSFLFGPTTSAGRVVTERSAMQLTAVYSCVRILAESIAGLPLHLFRFEDASRVKAVNHTLYGLLHDEPS